MKNQLHEIIENNKDLLEKGGMLSIVLNDAYLTVYSEYDEYKGGNKIITLVDTCDYKIDINLDQLINL